MRPPLTGTRLEILDRLVAGQSIDHITEVGRWRMAWARTDVEAVAATWLAAQPPDRTGGPTGPRGPIPHGTARGHRRCAALPDGPCAPCKQARNAQDRERVRRKRSA